MYLDSVTDAQSVVSGGALSHNTAREGGALYLLQSAITLSGALLQDNEAVGFSGGLGGAVAVIDSALTATAGTRFLRNQARAQQPLLATSGKGGGAIACQQLSSSGSLAIAGCVVLLRSFSDSSELLLGRQVDVC